MVAVAFVALLAAAPVAASKAPEAPAWTEVKDGLGFAAFGGTYPFEQSYLEFPKGKVRLPLSHGKSGVTREQPRAWVAQAAQQVAKTSTGTDALREVHAKMGARRAPFDLEALWKKLGVAMEGRTVTFDDAAPMAAHRRAITAVRETKP